MPSNQSYICIQSAGNGAPDVSTKEEPRESRDSMAKAARKKVVGRAASR